MSKRQEHPFLWPNRATRPVTPAKAGVQIELLMDSRLRGNDEKEIVTTVFGPLAI
jgi:hypothetical protein